MIAGIKLFFTGRYTSRYPLETPVLIAGFILCLLAVLATRNLFVFLFCWLLGVATLFMLSVINIRCFLHVTEE